MRRADYVAALQNERAHVEKNLAGDRRAARLDAIDAELDNFAEKPARRRREKADDGGKGAGDGTGSTE